MKTIKQLLDRLYKLSDEKITENVRFQKMTLDVVFLMSFEIPFLQPCIGLPSVVESVTTNHGAVI